MATLQERYSTAVHSKSLTVDERTTFSDTDVLGALALADRQLTQGWVTTGPDGQGYDIRPAPLAASLERLFAGDHKAATQIVRALADMAFIRARAQKVKLGRIVAHDMACKCLAWHRDGACRACGGHGKTLVPGTGKDGIGGFLSEHDCQACHGSGKRPFEREFRQEHQELARWLVVEMTREAGRAYPRALQAIGRLDL